MGAFGLTEPSAGSDAGGTRTTACKRWRQLDPERLEDLYHQCRRGRDLCRLRPDRQTGRKTSRHQRLHRREGHPGLFLRQEGKEDGYPLLADHGTDHAGLPDSRGKSARCRGGRLQGGDEDARRRADRHCLPGPGDRPGRAGCGGCLCQGTQAVRHADLPVSRGCSSSWPIWRPRSRLPGC